MKRQKQKKKNYNSGLFSIRIYLFKNKLNFCVTPQTHTADANFTPVEWELVKRDIQWMKNTKTKSEKTKRQHY